VQRYEPGGVELWIKRDDLNAPSFGGNKVRALEFLLGGVREGDAVLTVGGRGSTHVLSTAWHARALGARTIAVRWRHEMNPVAEEVAERAAELCARVHDTSNIASGMALALWLRATASRRAPPLHWVPFGGTAPLGMLGHVNAALELAGQVAAGELPAPRYVVVPMGTGGTVAGLALGFRIAQLDAIVVGARVAPRIPAQRRRLVWLARSTARLIERMSGAEGRIPTVSRSQLEIAHDAYGGAYGRTLPAGTEEAARFHRMVGPRLDDTYAAKALVAALALAGRGAATVLYWLTFDGRWMAAGEKGR
jgi:D-cysteine desulfhydrase